MERRHPDFHLGLRGSADRERSIVASLGRSNWSDGIEFRTVNGGITLDLPVGLSAEVRAETVNGSIKLRKST